MARVLLCVALLSFTACKTPREKHEPAARANLAALATLLELASSAPQVDAAATARLASVKDLKARYLDSNAVLIHLEELGNPTLRRKLPLRLTNRSPTVDLAAALGVTKDEPGAELDVSYSTGLSTQSNMDSVWQRMGTLRYVLVVRTQGLRDAEQTGEKTFEAGAWRGEVLVFDLAQKQLLGGFPLSGTSHGSVQTRPGRNAENLAADLALATRGNLNAVLRQHFPTVGPGDELN